MANARKSSRNGARYAIRRIIDALAGWLTFQQASRSRALYSEYYLYPPIHDVARAQGWTVFTQVKLVRKSSGAGASETIDFLFHRKDTSTAIIVEVKFLKATNVHSDLKETWGDIAKMRDLSLSDLERQRSFQANHTEKVLIIVGQVRHLEKLGASRSQDYGTVASMIKSAFSEELPSSVSRSWPQTYMKSEIRWVCIALFEKSWAKKAELVPVAKRRFLFKRQ